MIQTANCVMKFTTRFSFISYDKCLILFGNLK